jgi:hypothetical protein
MPSNPTNMHQKLDVSLLPSMRKIGLPHHQFQTRAFVVMWWPHKSAKSHRLRLHLHFPAAPSLLQLQILVPWPPSPLSSCPLCHPALDPRHHRHSSSTPSPLSSRTLSHTFLNPSLNDGTSQIQIPYLSTYHDQPDLNPNRSQICYPIINAGCTSSLTMMTRPDLNTYMEEEAPKFLLWCVLYYRGWIKDM